MTLLATKQRWITIKSSLTAKQRECGNKQALDVLIKAAAGNVITAGETARFRTVSRRGSLLTAGGSAPQHLGKRWEWLTTDASILYCIYYLP